MVETFYNVKNRSAGSVSYSIPEDRINRHFATGEIKRNIPFSELEKLSFQPGGRILMANYLQIESADAVDRLNIPAEQEYWYSEEQIRDLLTIGSLDELLDCLDFAPSGVIDILKKLAVSLPVNDYQKREAISKKTGFDVSKAIEHIRQEKADMENAAETPKQTRRVKPKEEPKPDQPTQDKVERRVKNTGNTREELKETITPIKKTVTGYKIVEQQKEEEEEEIVEEE